MSRIWTRLLLAGLLGALLPGIGPCGGALAAPESSGPRQVMIIPIHGEIAEPTLYILRRGLKEAEARGAEAVILDLHTPGGALDVTLDLIQALEKFHGRSIAYIDDEAMSAGAFVSATAGEIWFAPDGIIGAAAPVESTGQDVDATMKMKLVSYLKARVRAISEGKGYRGEVVSAMIDADSELKIDGKVIKEKGSLLSLTASEALQTYGQPPRPLLGAGIARDQSELLAKLFGPGVVVDRLDVTWSERFAVFLNHVSPALLGLGLLCLFIAFKTQSFGGFGIGGLILLGAVFLGSYVAGLSGHEPMVLFAVGLVLLALEAVFFHSAGLLGVAGLASMLVSFVWAMADLWPQEPLTVAWSTDAFVRPLVNVASGLVLGIVLAALLLRFLPKGWIWDRLIVRATVGGAAQAASAGPNDGPLLDRLIGRTGIAATALRPGGQVVIDGRHFAAKVELGALNAGDPIVVRSRSDFELIVEKC